MFVVVLGRKDQKASGRIPINIEALLNASASFIELFSKDKKKLKGSLVSAYQPYRVAEYIVLDYGYISI